MTKQRFTLIEKTDECEVFHWKTGSFRNSADGNQEFAWTVLEITRAFWDKHHQSDPFFDEENWLRPSIYRRMIVIFNEDPSGARKFKDDFSVYETICEYHVEVHLYTAAAQKRFRRTFAGAGKRGDTND